MKLASGKKELMVKRVEESSSLGPNKYSQKLKIESIEIIKAKASIVHALLAILIYLCCLILM